MFDRKRVIYRKIVNRETISYAFFGVLTSVENVVLFEMLSSKLEYKFANFITLLIVKLTAYICNKNFVFMSKTGTKIGLLKEFLRFIVARGLTMIVDYAGLIILVEVFARNIFFSKCVVTVIVIVLNYFIGKKHVFNNSLNKK